VTEASILHVPISVTELPAEPVAMTATEAQRKALAEAYDIVAVKSLAATVELSPMPGGGVAVDGRVVADIVQNCVVSLVPVDEHIDEPFSIRYVRDPDRLPRAGEEIVVEPDAVDLELLQGQTIDVGALAEEYFALAINPYPRAPGAVLPADADDDGGEKDSPFAVLAALAKSPKRRG
jgi:uncharacterized metal-binding protein YceD (DUF177 family)